MFIIDDNVKMKKKLISVLLSTYNGERFIKEQIESIKNQSLPVDEVIICDDCSTDNTVTIIKHFIDQNKLSNWFLFINKKNLGLGKNSLNQLKYIKGDFIFLSDQDDVWCIDKVKTMVEKMLSFPKIKLLSSMCTLIDKNSKPIKKDPANLLIKNEKSNGKLRRLGLKTWLGYSSITGCSICFRREVLDLSIKSGRPDLGISLGQDWFYGIISEILGGSYRIQKVLFKRRIHGYNSSLGQLRKETLLSTSYLKRLAILKQASEAHYFLINNENIRKLIRAQQKLDINKMANFISQRYHFIKSRNIIIWFLLLFNIKQYHYSSNNFLRGIQTWLTDFFYAYGINWKLKVNTKFYG